MNRTLVSVPRNRSARATTACSLMPRLMTALTLIGPRPAASAAAMPSRTLRSGADDDTLLEALRAIWTGRNDRYSELRSLETVDLPKVEMSFIGG